jgi:hypothetical protein
MALDPPNQVPHPLIVGIRCPIAVVAIVLAGGAARAEPNPEAEKLFRDGRALVKDGKIRAACDAFAASARLEPSVGTLLNLGDCRAKLGKTATAWAAFTDAVALAKSQHDKRLAEAERRAKELESGLSYITIEIDAAARVPGLKLTRNGIAVDEAAVGQATPVDPGDYAIQANVPGYVEWSAHIKLGPDGDRKTVVVKGLLKSEPIGETAPPPRSAPLPAPKPEPPRSPNPDALGVSRDERVRPSAFTPMRKGAVVVASAGSIALGVSTALALQARSLYDQAHSVCPGSTCSDLAASQKSRDAVSRANVATVVGGAGIAAIAGGVVLWLVGKPRDNESTGGNVRVVPAVSRDQVGISIARRF